VNNRRLEESSAAIEQRLQLRREELERDIPGITEFVALVKTRFIVEGVRRKLEGTLVKPSPPWDQFVRKRGEKSKG
jgi:hypothetical protein